MTHSNNSIITGKFQAQPGKEPVFRNWDGKTVVAKAPGRRKRDPTPKQVQLQEAFLMGSRYPKLLTITDSIYFQVEPEPVSYPDALYAIISPITQNCR
jgi:hypothetical protein